MSWSAAKKKIIAITANTRTMTVEIMVSRREGQVTFAVSALTCCRKVKGLVVFDAMCRSVLEEPVGRAFWMFPLPGECRCLERVSSRRISAFRFAHAFRTRKAGFPAPRAACLSVYIKPIPDPRKWQVSALSPNAASEPSSRPVPAMALLCLKTAYMASHRAIFKRSMRRRPDKFS